ncbi:hypothetical protein Tco_0359802 [Tanacetum coccineum]
MTPSVPRKFSCMTARNSVVACLILGELDPRLVSYECSCSMSHSWLAASASANLVAMRCPQSTTTVAAAAAKPWFRGSSPL